MSVAKEGTKHVAGRDGGMDQAAYLIGAIIVGAGMFGGWAAFLAEGGRDDVEGAGRLQASLRSYLVLGVVAAAPVPLFLSLLKSDVLRTLFASSGATGSENSAAYENYLIFLGLCLVAAFPSRTFIASISKQFLERLDRVDQTAREAAATAADAREVAHEAVEEVEAADEEAARVSEPQASYRPEMRRKFPVDLEAARQAESNRPDAEEPLPAEEPVMLTPDERQALRAMTKRKYRTLTGIAEDGGISRNRISELLESLADRGLARRATSPRTSGARWVITIKGIAALNAS